jgi:hypothetical protein
MVITKSLVGLLIECYFLNDGGCIPIKGNLHLLVLAEGAILMS